MQAEVKIGSHLVGESRPSLAIASSEVAAEVGQVDADPSDQILERKATAPSSDKASPKVQLRGR